jgi:hypothetical protein
MGALSRHQAAPVGVATSRLRMGSAFAFAGTIPVMVGMPAGDDRLKRLAVTAVQQSGLPDLRAEVFGRIRQRVPDLAVDRARVGALHNASTSELVAATRWALQHSRGPA